MDELKLETGFTRKLIARMLEKSIEKRYGYSIKIDLGSFHATVIDGKAHVSITADAEIEAAQLKRLVD